MSGLDKNRNRNQTISFRVSPEERRLLESRIQVTGLPKGEFILRSVLYGKIEVVAGKYQSDRLSLEMRRLREQLETVPDNKQDELLKDCKALLQAIINISQEDTYDGN